MARKLAILAALMGVLAIGAVAAVVISNAHKSTHSAATAGDDSATATNSSPAPLVVAKRTRRPAPTVDPVADEGAGSAAGGSSDGAKAAAGNGGLTLGPASGVPLKTDAAARGADNSSPDDLQGRMRSMARKLTVAEQEELARQLADLAQKRQWQQAKFRLASQDKLQQLATLQGGALKLSASQQQQVDALNGSMQPAVQTALAPYYAQESQIRQQQRAMENSGQSGAAFQQQISDIQSQRATVRQALDKSYQQTLIGILSPAQSQAIGLTSPPQPPAAKK